MPLLNRYADKHMNDDIHAAGYTLSDFLNHINEAGGAKPFADNTLKNKQVLRGRINSEVCLELANKLINIGVQTKEDFNKIDKVRITTLLRSAKGIGDAANNYPFMLTGD